MTGESLAEVMLPDAIDDGSVEQWIFLVRNPLSEAKSVERFIGEGLRAEGGRRPGIYSLGNQLDWSGRDFMERLLHIAAAEDANGSCGPGNMTENFHPLQCLLRSFDFQSPLVPLGVGGFRNGARSSRVDLHGPLIRLVLDCVQCMDALLIPSRKDRMEIDRQLGRCLFAGVLGWLQGIERFFVYQLSVASDDAKMVDGGCETVVGDGGAKP